MAMGVISLSGMTKQAGMIATANMNTQALIKNLRFLARLKAPNLAGEFDKIIDGDDQNRGLDKLYPVRNLFAHATFGVGAAKDSLKPHSLRLSADYVQIQEGEFDAAGILRYAEMIQDRGKRLRKLLEDNGYGFDNIPEDDG